jgi:predicted Rossmann fold flavoprotein
MYDVIVVGAGASGLLAAAVAGRRGLRVLLCDRNRRFGMKLRITGKGRCNLTNNCGIDEILENIPTGAKFLRSALSGFSPRDTMEMFEALGVPLKTERGRRVFPASNKAADVVGALWRYARDSGVTPRQCRVTDIEVSGGAVVGVADENGREDCRAAILCTGGMSYPHTGSTGDGYAIARRLGHSVSPASPSLVPLVVRGGVCGCLQGLALRNVRLRVYDSDAQGGKPLFDEQGELLFTHYGISGPLTLSASAHMRPRGGAGYTAVVDMKPALSEEKLDARILRDFLKNSNMDIQNALKGLMPAKMVPVVTALSGIPPDTKAHSVTREQRAVLRGLLKRLTLEIIGARPIEEAVITSGGVKLREIDPKTMQSKIARNLHFAGEILDADAYTGGFNLQIAWSTAVAAGRYVLAE